MKPFVLVGSFLMLAAAALAAAPGVYPRGPKNLMSPTYRPAAVTVAAPHGLTAREAKRLGRTAEKASDHQKLANFYRAEADKLDARAAAYEEAAADLRKNPVAKNFAAPGTSGRWEFAASGFRKDAAADRNTAAVHERLATGSLAGF